LPLGFFRVAHLLLLFLLEELMLLLSDGRVELFPEDFSFFTVDTRKVLLKAFQR
jgi:hypothetical protein